MHAGPQLLTYPDSLGGDLASLGALLDGPLAGLFGGIHILPPFLRPPTAASRQSPTARSTPASATGTTSRLLPTPTQARTFLDAIRGDRLEALYAVAVALGLRQGEILGLRWADVDLDVGKITVCQALQRVDGRLTFVEPKSRRSRRTIPMPPTVARALRAHRARQLEERLTGGPDWNEHDLVFVSTTGTPLDGRNLTRRFQAVLERAGLPRMRFHDARHTCASLLLAQGVQPRVIMETLGHSQIGLTLNTYAHVIPELQREAAERMEEVLAWAGTTKPDPVAVNVAVNEG